MSELQNTENKGAHPRILAILSLSLFVFFALLYINLAPNLLHQPWDSLNYAYSAETNGLKSIWGNHPLGHVFLSIVFSISQQLGYTGRALPLFQITNGVIGGLVVSAFFMMLVFLLKIPTLRALGFAIILGATYSFLFFAGTADIYILAMTFSLLAWASLIYEIALRKVAFPWLSGIFTGLAVLFHQLNILLLPVGLLMILLTPYEKNLSPRKIVPFALFTATSIIVASSGYYLIGFIATSSLSPLNIVQWARGYFDDPTYGRYLSSQYFSTARETAYQAIMIFPENGTVSLIRSEILAIFGLIMLIGLATNRAPQPNRKPILVAAFLDCLIIALLILWWEPQNLKFWLLALIPWIIFLTLSFDVVLGKAQYFLSNLRTRLQPIIDFVPLIFGIIILIININFGILKQHDDKSEDNIAFNRAMEIWISHSSSNDVLITAGDLVPDLLYWGNRPNTVNLYRSLQADDSTGDFHALRNMIDQALCNHQAVFLAPDASTYIPDEQLALVNVSRKDLGLFLKDYASKGTFAFWYTDLFDKKQLPVYVLTRSTACTNFTPPYSISRLRNE